MNDSPHGPVPVPQGKTPDQEIQDLLAELDADFGKKAKVREAAHKGLNRAFHEANPQTRLNGGKGPEDISASWIPIARVTHVTTQHCECCGDKVSFIGGEFIRFKSTRQRADILRRSEVCTDLFHFGATDLELEDRIETHTQLVHRCAGCIQVEKQALEIWDAAVKLTAPPEPKQTELDLPGLEDL